MTIDDAVERVAEQVDAIIEVELQKFEAWIEDHGGTPEEVEAAVRRQHQIFLEWRRNTLREVAAAVARDGGAVH